MTSSRESFKRYEGRSSASWSMLLSRVQIPLADGRSPTFGLSMSFLMRSRRLNKAVSPSHRGLFSSLPIVQVANSWTLAALAALSVSEYKGVEELFDDVPFPRAPIKSTIPLGLCSSQSVNSRKTQPNDQISYLRDLGS